MRWWRERPLVTDAVFAAVVGVLVALSSSPAGEGQDGVLPMDATAYALVAVASAGLVVRRRWPGVALAVALVTTMVFLQLRYPYGPVFLFSGVALYSVAAWRGYRYTRVAALASVVVHVTWAVLFEDDGALTAIIGSTLWIVAAVGAGTTVRLRREGVLRGLAEARRQAGYEERLRIAQEVHDVVGHSLAVISMNAGAALHVLGKPGPVPPEPLERSLRAIRQASNGALDELRATLATFTGTISGQPVGLSAVPGLVAATDVDGLAVRLDVDGAPGTVPAPVDLAGYRIVQEALANVVRHAQARHAGVRIAYGPDAVAITVTDDGRGADGAGTGTGIASMGERARSVGGTFVAGPREGGGFEVRASLPVRT
ncbi:sensor histidine kinase [Virgisporangium ochraceum]|uniref:histidine kinase n=1 Tax=Virgisporangium ochraceum TaxID=65505 RepID=A0A8J4EHP8_9ACTN|nr:histidine kinase [Virgisporangium ochraceum]GIJ75219.1 two-component sensor histidine kinase [Virgisporangium ochraceum]